MQFYVHKDFLSSDQSLLEYYGFHWPTEVSSASYYLFATMLVPLSLWANCEIRSGSNIQHMVLHLTKHIRLKKEMVKESEQHYLKGIFLTFNSCCDLVTVEETKTMSISKKGRQVWLSKQDQLWEAAKNHFHLLFRFNSHASIQQIKVIDDLADIWRMHTEAERDNQMAI